jgi:hypothetical protein
MYERTLACSGFLRASEGQLTGRYCNGRACYVCKPIRVANLMNGYVPQLQNLGNLYFLTLTAAKPTFDEYPERVQLMHNVIKIIRQNVRYYYGIKFKGLRKFETTYSSTDYRLHPHFHFLLDSFRAALLFQRLWQKKMRNEGIKVSVLAQNIRRFDKKTYLEMFKYMSKDISKESESTKKGKRTKSVLDISMINHICETNYRRRTFQSYGIKKISEDIEKIQSTFFTDPNYQDYYEFVDDTWYSTEAGSQLIPFQQEKRISSLKELIVF